MVCSLLWQRMRMCEHAPNFKFVSQYKDRCVWKGTVQPLQVSEQYVVKVAYRLGECPDVVVERPGLVGQGGHKVPHTYSDGSLCLYFPEMREWTPADSIAQLIVPWISHWLLHYEAWHVTGEWKGGGTHEVPPVNKENT